jgi:regulator of cell morphogenesis and NO signaling
MNARLPSTQAEHIAHGATRDRLAGLTHNATPPQDACKTWRALYTGIAQLSEDLAHHIHLEKNVLFVQCEAPQVVAKSTPAHSPCCGSCGG